MTEAPIFKDPEQQAHFDDFMAKFSAVGEVARSARMSGWEMHMTTDSETITLAIKQPSFVATPPLTPHAESAPTQSQEPGR